MQTAQVEAECHSSVLQINNDPALGSASMRAHLLQQQHDKCGGLGEYEASLAALFQQAGLYDDADREAHAALPTAGVFVPNLMSVLAADQFGRGNLDESYRLATEITREYPTFAPIYGVLGGIDFKLNRWDKAYQSAEKAVQLAPSPQSYMFLATCLYQLKRYPEVVAAVQHALQLDPRRIGNATGLTEGVYSLIILNRREEAANLLQQHMRADLNWRASEDLVRAARELGLVQ